MLIVARLMYERQMRGMGAKFPANGPPAAKCSSIPLTRSAAQPGDQRGWRGGRADNRQAGRWRIVPEEPIRMLLDQVPMWEYHRKKALARSFAPDAGCKRGRMMLPCAGSTFNRTRAGSREAGMSIRPVKRLIKAKPTMEGAGVHLRRAFGFGNTAEFDPFLLLDDFRNDVPEDYLKGFPWHPHRGIETITYVLAGTVQHGDSMGNRGAIAA